jgi:hypothetical protein
LVVVPIAECDPTPGAAGEFGLNSARNLLIMFLLLSHPPRLDEECVRAMKTKTRHRKSSKWRKKADSSPVAKGRRPKRPGRNPKKSRHWGGVGL